MTEGDGDDPEEDDPGTPPTSDRHDEFAPPTDGERAPGADASGGATASEGADQADDGGAPLEELAETARRRRSEAAAEDDVMDAFQEVEVDAVDEDALWEQLEDDGLGDAVAEPETGTERDVQVVRKRDYCMRCQYFSAPPEVRCTHDRGEILRLVDSDRFEVVDCPILAGEEELENLRR